MDYDPIQERNGGIGDKGGELAEAPPPIPQPSMQDVMNLLVSMQGRLETLAKENKIFTEELASKTAQFADGVSRQFNQQDDPRLGVTSDERFARRLVLGNRAADPEFIARNIPHATGVANVGVPTRDKED